jgi:HEAT repeat protein
VSSRSPRSIAGLLPGAGLLACALLSSSARPHGGTFPPPPPEPTGPPHNPGPGYSGPAGPGPAPSGPSSPGTAGAIPAGTPTGSPPKSPSTGANGRGPGPSTGAQAQGADSWETWWWFNKDPYLEIKKAVAKTNETAGGDGGTPHAAAGGIPSRALVRQKVVPALVHLLESERANDTTTGALMALARIGEPADLPSEASAAPRMVRALADANQEIAETSALALGILRNEGSIPTLADLLAAQQTGRTLVRSREVSSRTRAFAAYGLGLAALDSKQNRTRQLIARGLIDALQDGRSPSDVQVAAVIGLSLDPLEVEPVESTTAPWISRQTLLRFLLRFVAEPRSDRTARVHALTALARLADEVPAPLRSEVVECLLGFIEKEPKAETELQESAVQGLGRLAGTGNGAADRKARAAILRAFDAADPQIRAFAMISAAELGGRCGDDAPGTECRSALSSELARGRSSSRSWAALALGLFERIRLDRSLPSSEPTRRALRDWFSAARGRSEVGSGALALGLCRELRAEKLLRARLADSSEDTGQGFVALALGMIGASDSVGELRDLVRASRYRPQLLEQVAEALALLGDKETAVSIAGLLAEARGLAAQSSYAGALGFVGDARCVDPLIDLMQRKELPASARGLAAAALGGVAEERLLPWRTSISFGLNYRAVTASLLSGDGTGILEIL